MFGEWGPGVRGGILVNGEVRGRCLVNGEVNCGSLVNGAVGVNVW